MAFVDSRKYVAASNQYDSAADSTSLSVTGNLTLEGWFKFTTLPASGTDYTLAGKWVDSGSQDDYLFELQNVAGVYKIRMINSNDGSSVGLATINWTPTAGVWYHIGIVFTAATPQIELFINGVSQGTATGTLKTSIHNGTGEFDIGINNATGQPLNGQVFLLRVWAATRSGAQLLANQCTLLGTTTNLSAEWSLDNTLNDNSGNSNTLTGHNTPTFIADFPATCAVILNSGFFLAAAR